MTVIKEQFDNEPIPPQGFLVPDHYEQNPWRESLQGSLPSQESEKNSRLNHIYFQTGANTHNSRR